MDYKSPIELYTHGPIFKEIEDDVMRATVNVGVRIDKEELLRALAYDRGQYKAGYEAAERKYKRPQGEWVNYCQDGICHFVGTCSVCGNRNDIPPIESAHYCPSCGAEMKGYEE